MKISIDRIKKEKEVSLRYEDEQFQNKPLRESTQGPLKIKFVLSLVGNANIRIKGEIEGNFELICDRCADSFLQYKKIELDEIFELSKKELSDRMVDLDSKVKDVVITSFPIKILCNENCKGICLGCGVNLNKEKCKCINK
jgi:uncharacterized protein